jgi:replication-associated recombination protein RarA
MPKQEKCEFSVDERFQFIEQFVGMVKRKVMNSMIITGDGGLGKTYTVINTLKKLGLKEDTIGEYSGDFIVIKGYSTAKALYRTLWENNDKIIIFDDCDSIHRDPIGANILKGALDSEEKRIITWGAEFSEREELPNRFEFTGRVIFISNLPLMKFPQALLSRSMKVDLTLTTNEKVDRIAHVFQEVDADAFDKKLALDFVRKNAEKFTDLNVRSALNVLKLAKDIGEGWERIALYTVMA